MEIDAEQLMENIEKTGFADGVGDGATDTQATEPAPEEIKPTEEPPASSSFSFKTIDDLMNHELEYKASGKEVKENLATILKRASQGYNYAQRMNELNSEREIFEREHSPKISEAQKLQEKWTPYEQYAKENPEWYEHWQNAYANRDQQLTQPGDENYDPSQAQLQQIQTLIEQKLQPVNSFLEQQQSQQQQQVVSAEDQKLESQIKSIRETYKDIDFDATDADSGKSLEYQVLEFGIENQINDFDKAFKAFYHDELVKRQVETAKENWVKDQQDQRKNGIIDIRSTPSKSSQPPDLSKVSWDQASDVALNWLANSKQ